MIVPKVKSTILTLVIGASLFFSSDAFAYDWSMVTSVSNIESTYVPQTIQFQIPDNAGNCAAGTSLHWNVRGTTEASQIANAQAAFAVLLSAKNNGRSIRIFGNNADCSIDYMYLL